LGAVCKIHKDFEGLEPAIRSPDSFGEDILDMMVEDDMLEIIKDSETGEEFVKPK